MVSKFFVSLTFVASLAAGSVLADGHIAGAIKARQGQMQLYQHYVGILGGMARGQVDYDAQAAQAAADNLLAVASLNAMTLWPQGSDMESTTGTRAKPAIWQNFPDVGAKAQALTDGASAMALTAGQDLDALKAAIGGVGGACSACHRAYRGRK